MELYDIAFFLPPGLESKICKHFITHGCKLGSRCRFLHCTPEELANKMATNDQGFPHRNSRGHSSGGGGRFEGSGKQYESNGDSFSPPNANSPPIHHPPPKEEHRSKVNHQELDSENNREVDS